MKTAWIRFALVLLLGSTSAAPATADDQHPAELGPLAATFDSCPDAGTCTFHQGPTRLVVLLADVDAPRLEGGCAKEIVTARRARDGLIGLLRSAKAIALQLVGAPDASGRVTAHVFADGLDVGRILMKQGLAGSKANWMRKGWC